MSSRDAAANRQRLAGLDALRLSAMLLVTLQHGLSALDRYDLTSPGGVNLGQAGVAIFCAISGYLAFRRDDEAPGRWLWARLAQIFPAYWLAMLFSFMVTWVFQVKPFTAAQFVSQMLGLGYFTHGWELVNVVSWFISLILLCYLIATLAKWLRAPAYVLGAASLVAWVLVYMRWEIDLSRHVLAFSLAGLLSLRAPRAWIVWLAVAPLLFCPPWPQFSYAALALAALAAMLAWRFTPPGIIQAMANHVYEFFLLHGIFLVGCIHFLPTRPLLGISLGIVASMGGAVGLRRLVAGLPARLGHPVLQLK